MAKEKETVVDEESTEKTAEETVETKEDEITVEDQLKNLEDEVNTWKTDYYKVSVSYTHLDVYKRQV